MRSICLFRLRSFFAFAASIFCGLMPVLGAGAHGGAHELGARGERELFHPAPYRYAESIPALVEVSLNITTRSPEARDFFNQGFALLSAGWPQEAERCFQQAHRLDEKALMPQWGIAVSRLLRDPEESLPWLYALEDAGDDPDLTAVEKAFLRSLPPDEAVSEGRLDVWQRQFVEGLRSGIRRLPEEPELRAFLAMLLADAWYGRWEVLGESPDTALKLIASVLQDVPQHPVRRLGLKLWANGRRHDPYRTRKPYFDLQRLRLSPALPVHWHLLSAFLAERGRLDEALRHGEMAARIQMQWAARKNVPPDRLPDYARQRSEQARQFLAAGAPLAALAVAHELIRTPRHPVWNESSNGFGAVFEGRKALIDVCFSLGLWEELRAACNDGRISPFESGRAGAEQAFALAIAAYFMGDHSEYQRAAQRLRGLARATRTEFEAGKPEKGATQAAGHGHDGMLDWLRSGGEDYLAALDWDASVRALEMNRKGRSAEAGELLSRCQRTPPLLRARLLWSVGARQLAKQALLNAAALPLAERVKVFKAMEGEALPDELPLSAGLTREQRLRARQPGFATESGIATWNPAVLPDISAPLLDGSRLDRQSVRGRHTAVILFYSGSCSHCVEQLEAVREAASLLDDANLQVVAVAGEGSAELKSWLKSQAPFPVRFGADADEKSFRSLGAYDEIEDNPLHALLYIDPAGRILWKDVGCSPFMDINFFVRETLRLRKAYPLD